jgi:integrase
LLEAVEDRPRDHALIRLLYNGGLRVSELVTLRWRNLVEGVANVTGKGGKTRVVRLSRGTWAELQALRADETIGEDYVFPMSAVNAWKRVKRAARLAEISEVPVSPHCATPTAPCAAPWRRSGDRTRHFGACVDRDDQSLSARAAREVQRRLPRALRSNEAPARRRRRRLIFAIA